jgi:phosphatidate cytidylyltransferase
MPKNNLVQRLLVAGVLLPVGLAVIFLGGVYYAAFIALILGLAAWEYVDLFSKGGHQPAKWLVVLGALALLVGRYLDGFVSSPLILSFIVLISMVYHLVQFERGREEAGSDFAITLGGIVYIGWIGSYFISLRMLPDGAWWFLAVMAAVWFADTAAYFVGVRFGKHKLSPRLSPKKSWEGYIGGIIFSPFATAGLVALWRLWANPQIAPQITPWLGALFGVVFVILPTLGDLGESMIKREFNQKDSSNLLPGHGGAFDRIDSWLWGAVIGYYVVVYLAGF